MKHTVETSSQKNKNNSKKLLVWLLAIIFCIGMIVLTGIKLNSMSRTKDNYTLSFESNFINNCKASGGTKEFCGCMLSSLKQNYSYNQAQYFDENSNSTIARLALEKIATQCRKN